MFRIYLFLFFCLSLYADAKVEIYATSIEVQDGNVKAYDGVSVVYRDYFLNADKASYDKNTSILELFGNVSATYGNHYKLLGKYARLDLAKKEKSFKPFFMLEKKSKVWISADEGCAIDKDYAIESGVISGCDPNDPLWEMQFSSSDYNSEDMWLNLYNVRVYIYDIPVLYTPYFGYSLNTKRRTGFLIPSFGLSAKEGLYFQQPIYIAEQNWWDLEFRPQIRSQRGYGLYGAFRFVDSQISKGSIEFGSFKEKKSYFLK